MRLSTALAALGATAAAALPQVEIKGNQFYFTGNGSEFKIRGLAYQPGGQSAFKSDGNDKFDPLSRPDQCRRDAAVIQSLGANVIRVYNLHADLNHDECVTVFNNAGIYLMLDVNSPVVNTHINKENAKSTYHHGYLENIFKVVEAFKGYSNVIAFFAGNEVIDDKKQARDNPPYIRAVTRDLKQYIKKHSDRFIAVGYAATDTRSASGAGKDSVVDLWNYLGCSIEGEEDDMSRADFFAVNIYSWCGDATFEESGYPELVKDFEKTSLPIFWSEHGCNEPVGSPRPFNEIAAMYGRDDMVKTFAGGIVFEYTQEDNKFGLVKMADTKDTESSDVELMKDFDNLSKQYDDVDWNKIKNIKTENMQVVPPPKCSSDMILGKSNGFASDFSAIPSLPSEAQGFMDDGVTGASPGKLMDTVDYKFPQNIMDSNGKQVNAQFALVEMPDAKVNDAPSNKGPGGSSGDGDESAASSVALASAALLAPVVAAIAAVL
ncbi:glycolipid anchored surface protein [Apiospora aurea]|uniref:1,3-beta-glucanosyltransferase n=1 Tax=Apiospora aurea TaxID=335848 RepID=A0ABR1QNR1_9PEZI